MHEYYYISGEAKANTFDTSGEAKAKAKDKLSSAQEILGGIKDGGTAYCYKCDCQGLNTFDLKCWCCSRDRDHYYHYHAEEDCNHDCVFKN